MRTVTYKSVLQGVLKRDGGGNLTADDAQALLVIEYIADRLRTAWEYYVWPECFVTELRRFRAEWDDGAIYAIGAEVWFVDSTGAGAYYAASAVTVAAESPETTPAKWTALTTLRRFVAFDQAGLSEFEACVGAWTGDPESDAGALRVAFKVTRDGILLDPACPLDGVWLKVRLKCPDFAAEVYASAAEYAERAVIYYAETGECYRVIEETDAGDNPVDDEDMFVKLDFPMILARAVKTGALADWMRSDGEGSAVKTRDAEDKFIELLDDQVWQLTKLQGQTGRPDVIPAP